MRLHVLIASAAFVVACGSSQESASSEDGGPVASTNARGRSLAANTCSGCHGTSFSGTPVAGWSPNLTSDVASGLGGWSDAEIRTAIREGIAKGGRKLCTTMPRFDASRLADDELAQIVAYLRSLPAVVSPRQGTCNAPPK